MKTPGTDVIRAVIRKKIAIVFCLSPSNEYMLNLIFTFQSYLTAVTTVL